MDWCDYYHYPMGKVSFILNILGMKSIMQIAIECDLTWNQVNNIVKIENIVPAQKIGKRKFFDIYQEDIIHQLLYFLGLVNEITYESKMNVKETFEDFKKRTYTKN